MTDSYVKNLKQASVGKDLCWTISKPDKSTKTSAISTSVYTKKVREKKNWNHERESKTFNSVFVTIDTKSIY